MYNHAQHNHKDSLGILVEVSNLFYITYYIT